VLIFGVIAKGTSRIFRCRALEVPQWMFEAAACSRAQQASAPVVTYQELRKLCKLVDSS